MRTSLVLTLIAYLAITLAYGVVNPILEAPDASGHFFVTVHIAETGNLPDLTEGYDPLMGQEVVQSPLYYWLGSWLIRPILPSNIKTAFTFNPFVERGNPAAETNINLIAHPEGQSWEGAVLAVHLLRLLSTLFGLGTLLLIYQMGRTLWTQQPENALLATGLVAFLPQFNFLHSYVNNDVAIIFFATLTLYLLQEAAIKPTSGFRHYGLLGVTASGAFLSKASGILLLGYVPIVIGLLAWRLPAVRQRVMTKLALYGITVLTFCGWLFWRNYQLYGDITATNQFAELLGSREPNAFLQTLFSDLGSVWYSSIAVFGWFNIVPPQWVYWLWQAIIILALIGLVLVIFRRTLPTLQTLVFSGWFCIVLIGLVAFMMQTAAAQGRLLFPALAPLTLAIAGGLAAILPIRIRHLLLATLCCTTVYCLFGVIAPRYRLPEIYMERVPATLIPVDTPLENGTTLLGIHLPTNEAQIGDLLPVELFMRADERVAESASLRVQLLTPDGVDGGTYQSLPAGGLYPVNFWERDRLVKLRVEIPVNADAVVPTEMGLHVGWDTPDSSQIPVGFVKVVPPKWATVDGTVGQFESVLDIAKVDMLPTIVEAGDAVTVAVVWRVNEAISADYTTFIHLGLPNQPPLATGDAKPRNGHYPTHWWEAGEVIEDQYTLLIPATLPAGRYAVRLGLYNADGRLAPRLTESSPTDYAIEIGTIVVAAP